MGTTKYSFTEIFEKDIVVNNNSNHSKRLCTRKTVC